METSYRWMTTVFGENGTEFHLALPSFIPTSISTVYEVDPLSILQAWEAHPEKKKNLPMRDETTNAYLIKGELAQYRVQKLLENSHDIPAEMPCFWVNGSSEISSSLDCHSGDLLVALCQHGVKKIPICLIGKLSDGDGGFDTIAEQKLVTASSPGITATDLEIVRGRAEEAIVSISGRNYTTSFLMKQLADRINAYANHEKDARDDYLGKKSYADEVKPTDYESAKAEAEDLNNKNRKNYIRSELAEIMDFMNAPQIRYNSQEFAQYRYRLMDQEKAAEKLKWYDSFQAAREASTILLSAGVHGISLPSQYDGRAIAELLKPMVLENRAQIENPTGSAVELADRLDKTHEMLSTRRMSLKHGGAEPKSVERLEYIIVPLAHAIMNDPAALALCRNELSQTVNASLNWLTKNPEATRLVDEPIVEVTKPFGYKPVVKDKGPTIRV